MKKRSIYLVALFILPLSVFGQRYIPESKETQSPTIKSIESVKEWFCITMEMDTLLRSSNPKLGTLAEFEERLQKDIAKHSMRLKSTLADEEVLTIPVIVHVIHNGQPVGVGSNISTEQLNSQIDAFNEHFRKVGTGANDNPVGADVRIEFAPALIDEKGATLDEPGIDRVLSGQDDWSRSEIESELKPSTYWDPNQYFNIWTLNFGSEDEGLLGYAQFPSGSGLDGMNNDEGPASTDGVVMNFQAYGTVSTPFPYNEGKVVSHEVGHWLGLRHIWGDGGCFLDDYCDDTPNANGARWSSALLGCPTDDECGEGLRPVDNYMDYSNDPCKNTFTQEQKVRIRTVMEVSPRRMELKSSKVHLEGDFPVAVFSSDNTSGCEGGTIQFTDESTNSPNSWSWTFYNDLGLKIGESTEQNPQQIFSNIGNYDVELAVANADGEDEVRYNNYIVIVSNTLVSTIDEDFEDTETALTNWVIYNPDDDRTFEFSTRSAFGQGSGSIYYDNYTDRGDAGGGEEDFLISPKMDFSLLNNPYFLFDYAYAQLDESSGDTLTILYSTDCGGTFHPLWSKGGRQLATFSPVDQAFNALPFQWDSVQISLAELAGFSEVHFAIAFVSGYGNNLFLDNIQVKDGAGDNLPQPVSIRSSDSSICPMDIVMFDDQTPEFPTSWLWTFEGGTPDTSTLQHPIIQYQTPGQYDVTLKVGNEFGEATETFESFIEVNDKPTLSIEADNNSLCPGEEVTLTASGALNFVWYDERTIDPVSEESTYSTLFFENRKVSVLGTNIIGCADTTSILIELEASASINASPSETVICEGETVLLTASGGESYIWLSKNDTLSTETTLEYTVTSSRVIGLKGTQTGVCPGFDKAIVRVDIPLAEINKDGNILTASEGESYQWFVGGEEIADASSQVYTAVASGSYSVRIANKTGCSALSDEVVVVVIGIEESDISANLYCYPNPSTGNFSLRMSGAQIGIFEYKITDTLGKLVKKGKFENFRGRYDHEIQFDGAAGVYNVNVSDGEYFGNIRVIRF